MSINERIKQARRAAGLTQRQLGDSIGAIYATISNYETGRVIPDANKLGEIAEATGVSTEWLISGKEKPEAEIMEAVPCKWERELLTKQQNVIESQQQTISKLVELIGGAKK